MRVLHIGKYFAPVPGGMERFLADLVVAQRAAGDDVFVLVHADRPDDGKGDPHWLMRCPVWLKLVFAPISPAFPYYLHRAIKRHVPDVLHIHTPNVSGFWALMLPAARRLPWVVHWHSDVEPSRFRWSLRIAYPFYQVFERVLLARADAIIVTSRPYLKSSVPLRPWRHKCQVIPLALDPKRLPSVVAESAAGLWQEGRLRLLALGRLTYYKGFETLIRAVAGLPNVQLIIVGEGEERAHLELVLAEIGHPPWIILAGQADDDTCRRLLAGCDVFCLPSRERTEAFGIVLLEAMRYGKPVVVGRIRGSGVTWLVRDDDNGILLPPDDVSAWQDGLAALARDPRRRARLGENGRRRLFGEFDIGKLVPRIAALYRSLLPDAPDITVKQELPLIVIPALNEEGSIGEVIVRVHGHGFRDVLVLDDGSVDHTGVIARQHGAVVLRAPLAQGTWGAIQTGIRYALRHGYPGVITMDADGQHEPEYLPKLVEAVADADVVIGACPERGSRLRQIAWAYFRGLTGFAYEDLTSGLRYYGLRACRVLSQDEATLLDYQDIGVLLLLRKARLTIREIPVAMNPRQHGASRIFSSWWTVARYMAETTLLCLARWKQKPSSHD